ncbi:sigma-70 family RNA polymerase sigma factor [Streptosporangium sp. NPDC000239]|uniref:RNA polymerase sigma factor n=1 Tax=Streptosporangium jomthongense TaxID=1193683 RepID=A0ABV8F2K7_9ACTN
MTSVSLGGAVEDRTEDAADGESLLVAAARGGDERAFAELWSMARRPAFGVCYHLTGNRADALDALQDTHLAAWRGLPAFQGRSPFRAWVLAIARNASHSVIRRRPPRDALMAEVAEELLVADPFEDSVARLADLRRALTGLPASHREALLLWAGGLTYEQVALSLGVPLNTVRAWIHRARRRLQTGLADG